MFDVTSSSSFNKSTIEPLTRSMSQTPVNEKRRNYRFYAGDPAIHPAEKRLYANGDFEGTPLHVSGCADPRDVTRTDRPYYDLPVPKFKLDRCWVGVIPAKEVTFRNLNDNITKTFLTDICKRFGEIDDCKIYYDRQTKKHLGLGTVIFKTTKAARECVNSLNMTTKMGSVISVSLETSGQERTKQYATLIRAQEQEKAAQEKALAASAAASPPPSIESNHPKQSERSHLSMQLPNNHKITNNYSQSSNSYSNQDHYRSSKYQSSSSGRYDSRNSHHSIHDHPEQFSFDPYGSFGNNNNNNNSNNYKSSRRSRHRSHHRRPHSQQNRRKRKPSTSTTSSSTSRSSSSSSTSSNSSSTSKSYSRSSSSSSSKSSYSSTHSPNRKSTNDSRKKLNDDEDQRPSLDERIAALFQQQQTTNPSSIPSKPHHRPLPSPNVPPPTHFPYPPPPLPTPLTNVVGSHHHHQQSYGVVNNFNFFGNSFPPASFLNSTGGTNWQDMFKQPPPSSTTITTTTTTINNQSNGFQPYANDNHDERERKTNDLTTAVTNIVSGELVEILRKDLAKKLIETLVYKSIETWYDNEERKDKIRKIKLAETSTNEQISSNEQSNSLHHSISNPSLERTPDDTPSPATPLTAPTFNSSSSSTNLSTYFEHMRDSIGSSVRTQMPKIPTFKKRSIPDEKPVIPQKPVTPIEKKEPQKPPLPQQQRKIPRKRLSSSSSESNITPENDDSQSRDSVSVPNDDISSSETKNHHKPSIDQPTPEEEEGEIKDDDEEEEEEAVAEERNTSKQTHVELSQPPPPSPPSPSPSPLPLVKKTTNKNNVKQNKKPGPPKKRKIEQIKSEPVQEQDDLDNSTLAKRKKSATNLHQTSTNNDFNIQPIETFNLLDNLTIQARSSPKLYNPFAYIEFEHDYAIMTRQPVPVAKRLTVDGLNDMGVQPPIIIPPRPKFPPREHDAEMRIMYELDHGVDEEDMSYLKQSFQKLCEEGHSCTMKTRWVDHPPSRDSIFVKKTLQKHRTGCARTEGYYKIVKDEKLPILKTSDGSQSLSVLPQAMLDTSRTTGAQMSRELRSEHRRNLLALGDAEFADHFKFSQLKLRKKRLRYAKSSIHAWGLFACEPIAMEDMVIEYVGETIRQSVGDLREKQYELEGINSNYMFRVDSDTIVDATKCGNLARFINHSCDPNCYAKIIPVESQKKIVIYSKRDIRLGEEITYDYKFPLEEQKIPCRCGTPTCRGSLN